MDSKEAIENYFKLLKDVLEDFGQLNKPSQIYNVDESGMHLDHVVVKRSAKCTVSSFWQ